MSITDDNIRKFIESAIEIYDEETLQNADKLTYKMLVEKAAKKAFREKCNASRIKQCYGYFRSYYNNHKLNKGKKVANGALKLADVEELLKADHRWVKLQQVLEYAPKYYYFKQEVVNQLSNKKERYFLFLQVNEALIQQVYDVIRVYFNSFFESIYTGFNSIAIIMESPKQLNVFLTAFSALKKK